MEKSLASKDLNISSESYISDDASLEQQGSPEPALKRSLKARHLAMISIGGVIGQGLFLSSGANLYQGGMALLAAYSIIGFVVFWVTFSLGEMATYIPVSGSFTIFCKRFVDSSFGSMIGYNYWACWSIITAAEFVALQLVMEYWTDAVPGWAWSLVYLVIIFALNLFGARSYGEAEYWFSLIKVLTIIVFIIVGCLISGGVIGYVLHSHICPDAGEVYGFKYWQNGGAFPHGALGVVNSLVLASLSMQGTEILGITAGESSNPQKQVPRAIRNVFWRILLFYLCSGKFVSLPESFWKHNMFSGGRTAAVSPFTLVFSKGSLASVSHIINAVILTTILSCANSGLYVSSRMLLALSQEGDAWHKLSYITRRGVPIGALICTALVSVVTFITSVIPGQALYQVLTSLAGISGFVTWFGISLAHYRFRKAFKAQNRDLSVLPLKAPWHPFGDLFDMFACIVIALLTGYSYFVPPNPVGLVGNYAGLILCAIGYGVTKLYTKSKIVPLTEIDLVTGAVHLESEEREQEKQAEPRYRRLWKRAISVFT
ncbi:amino acid permease/ SLC12A domain-containing protein [Dichotomocladium elegans]|nr:amino acid permease/ SLC12A domain-containing protein [Dichotomocladium elegans]